MADPNRTTPPPSPMPVWPWLVAPGLMLLLIVGFTAGLLLVSRGAKAGPRPEPEALAVREPQPAQPAEPPAERTHVEERNVSPEVTRPGPLGKEPVLPTRKLEPAAEFEPARRTPDRTPAVVRTEPKLPRLSEALRMAAPGEAVREVPRASPEREARYDAVVERFVLYDIGRLAAPGAAADLEALGPDAIRALVRGLNRSAKLEASCPVVSISNKLDRLLATCNDPELLAEVRDGVGKGVGPTLHHAYLTALKQNCAERLKKLKDQMKPRVSQLVAALKSKDAETRRKAANTLGLAGAEAKAAVPALAEALKDNDPEARGYAASALAAIGAPAAPALLKAADAGADGDVRGLAGLALEAIDPDFRAALPALRRAPPLKGAATQSGKEPCYRTVSELAAAAAEPGDAARPALRELALRRGEQALAALVLAAVSDDRELRQVGHDMLLKYLSNRPDDKAEEEAARRLERARRAMSDGAGEKANEGLRALIRSHPRTRAAEEARQLLAEAAE